MQSTTVSQKNKYPSKVVLQHDQSMELEPHVLAFSFISQGHISPLTHFCFKLAHQKIKVTFVSVLFPGLSPTGKLQTPQIPAELSDRVCVETLPFMYGQADKPRLTTVSNFFNAVDGLQPSFEQLLIRIHERSKLDFVVSDSLYGWPQQVARKLGIPHASFWTCALASLTIDYHVPLLLENGDIPVTEANRENTISYVPGLAPMPASHLPFTFHEGKSADSTYERVVRRSSVMKDDEWVIVNSCEELEPEVFKAVREKVNRRCIAVGPLLPLHTLGVEEDERYKVDAGAASMWQQDTECLTWLSQRHPASVLYVSFGSAVKLTLEEFNTLSRGLEIFGQAFLWILRNGRVEGLLEEEFELFKERTGLTGLVVEWAPQVEVLSHPSTGAFLTHCGWNSVVESICGGVPMLGWPKLVEQNLNCELFVSKGLGVRLTDERYMPLGADEVACKITSVISNGNMRERVRKAQASVKLAVREDGTSYGNLHAFCSHVKVQKF